MLGVWFMATDYVTTPITKSGQIFYGMILGVLTGLFRIMGGSAEGVSYAIIFGNLLIPLIERIPVSTSFWKRGMNRRVTGFERCHGADPDHIGGGSCSGRHL